jgi:plasmid stabilization system protein ParE
MNILWTAPAEADLDGIFDHILANNPQAALSVYERIRERVGRLTSFPYTGRPSRLHDTRELRDGAEIMSRFISACILTPAAQHCSGSITHCLKNVAA